MVCVLQYNNKLTENKKKKGYILGIFPATRFRVTMMDLSEK